MADCVDDRVEAGGELGEEAGKLGDEWGDAGFGSYAGQEDDEGVRAPDAGPQQDVRDGDLGDLELGALILVVLKHNDRGELPKSFILC